MLLIFHFYSLGLLNLDGEPLVLRLNIAPGHSNTHLALETKTSVLGLDLKKILVYVIIVQHQKICIKCDSI